MRSFLELNWLAKSDKDIPLPPVLSSNEEGTAGGYYIPPKKGETLINGLHYPLDKGMIVINDSAYHECPEAVIAHEWRHIWQIYQGWPNTKGIDWFDLDESTPFRQRIVEYFTSNPRELDALFYEIKMTNCIHAQQMYEWIVKSKEVSQ
ncbi:hypothetical protein LCGC14_2129810 [marine sediment metagenome]|uniref:Uncharacterized protein n=1 Tax=marine sediment metagenome TaxID=412755 RepID=A0A0F9GET7_9ZZZZ